MFNKTEKEIDKFTVDIKTTENHEKLLTYINSGFFSSLKLLISVSSTFSIYWKVVLPFIISLSALLLLSLIEPIGKELNNILNMTYVLVIFLCLVSFTVAYILSSKKYFISSIEKSKNLIDKDEKS